MIYRQLWDTLARHGLERIAAAGKMFDPHFHQAIERVETTEHPDGTVVEVLAGRIIFSTGGSCGRASCASRCIRKRIDGGKVVAVAAAQQMIASAVDSIRGD